MDPRPDHRRATARHLDQLKAQVSSFWDRYGSADWLQPVVGRIKSYVEEGTHKIAGMAAGVGTSTLGGLGSLWSWW